MISLYVSPFGFETLGSKYSSQGVSHLTILTTVYIQYIQQGKTTPPTTHPAPGEHTLMLEAARRHLEARGVRQEQNRKLRYLGLRNATRKKHEGQ